MEEFPITANSTAENAPVELLSRRHQMFPVLSDADITRMRRFGTPQDFKRGDTVCAAGGPSHGMFVVLEGALSISQRDGLGHVAPIRSQGPGQFLAEVAQLSGGRTLVDGHADEDVEVLLIPPEQLRALIIAEADLGERITRALIQYDETLRKPLRDAGLVTRDAREVERKKVGLHKARRAPQYSKR